MLDSLVMSIDAIEVVDLVVVITVDVMVLEFTGVDDSALIEVEAVDSIVVAIDATIDVILLEVDGVGESAIVVVGTATVLLCCDIHGYNRRCSGRV